MFSSAKFPKIDFNSLSEKLTDNEKQMLPFIFHAKTGELRKGKVKFTPLKATKEKQVTEYGCILLRQQITLQLYASGRNV
jgi:hypothetical protein